MAESEPKAVERLMEYARQRRRAAGDAPAVPPDTRRALQSEVTRVYTTTPATPVRDRLFGWFLWPRLAYGAALIMATLAAFVFWVPSQPKQKVSRPMESRSLTRAPSELDALPASPPALAFSESKDLASASSVGVKEPAPSLSLRETNVAEDELGQIDPRISASETLARAEVADAKLRSSANDLAKADAIMASQLNELVMANDPVRGVQPLAENQVAARFARVEPALRRNFNSPPPTEVLNTFRIESEGETIRVIDADGSVYEGRQQRALALSSDFNARPPVGVNDSDQGSTMPALAGAERDHAVPQSQSAMPMPTVAMQYSFRVAGTNRTLNQLVVFEGNWIEPEVRLQDAQRQFGLAQGEGARGAAANVPAKPNQQNQVNNQATIGRSLIQGQATIGSSNQLFINAQPVP